jgi:hypothetical protein
VVDELERTEAFLARHVLRRSTMTGARDGAGGDHGTDDGADDDLVYRPRRTTSTWT